MADNSGATNVVQTANGNAAATTGDGTQQGQQQQQPQQGFFGILKGLVIRMAIIYMISSFFRRGSTPATPATTDGTSPQAQGSYIYTTNLFEKGTFMDMYVYVSENEEMKDFDESELFWAKKGLIYGDWESGPNKDGTHEFSGSIPASKAVQNNGSIYIHVYVVKEGNSPDPKMKERYSKRDIVYRSMQLNKFKKRRFLETKNLLTGETEVHPDLIKKPNSSEFEILSHWHPNLTINFLDDHTSWVKGHIPAPLDEYVEFVPGHAKYRPVLYFNDYWNLNSEYQPINDTIQMLNFTLTYTPISLWRWQMYAAQGMRNKWTNMLGGGVGEEDQDQDSLKTAFLETNPYLLALTIIVSIVHSVFEFLAFKNDIQFWRSRKSLEGLSVRSVFFNVFQSGIVLLYVFDNETNTVVRISVFIGLLIEIWKIHKVVNVKADRENRIFGLIPRISLEDKSTYTESHTKEYDTMAFKYLSWLLFPMLACYAVYSIVYVEQKGWYSWVLNMMYGFLLTFGFIMMTPQLFINYKLKSVAHLPWRMLTYKALNTFIDDIFAFVIKMPTLYRIGCLRDDVIFFIFLYQRYIYKIDPKRVNEFGTSQEMFEENGDNTQSVQGEEGNRAIEDSDKNSDTVEEKAKTSDTVEEKAKTSDTVEEKAKSSDTVEEKAAPPKSKKEKKND
ncbi:putative lipid scramblase CLPTM1 [Ruditapes philippinarum]|uniref:putative lipid scramblase CLPTM1 n=1 Tax=Ruditapes philippinarum TaxID=129788 RepID=UPI00295A8625|nr:putative lipid scramblase CLPTM1 [Ruditapes philippinarum]